MINENEKQIDETQILAEWNEGEDKITAEDWNAACDYWDTLHDQHGLRGLEGRF